MKKVIVVITLLFVGAANYPTFAQKNKVKNPAKKTLVKTWVKVYNDVVIGTDNNSKEGQFFLPSNGQVIKLGSESGVRQKIGLMYYVNTSGNYGALTAPGNFQQLVTGSAWDLSTPFFQNKEAFGDWSSVELNSLMIWRKANEGEKFGQIEPGNWKSFDALFKKVNDGNAKLAYKQNWEFPASGDLILMQLNGTTRMIAQVIAVSQNPKKGFIRMNIAVEGKSNMPKNGASIMAEEQSDKEVLVK